MNTINFELLQDISNAAQLAHILRQESNLTWTTIEKQYVAIDGVKVQVSITALANSKTEVYLEDGSDWISTFNIFSAVEILDRALNFKSVPVQLDFLGMAS